MTKTCDRRGLFESPPPYPDELTELLRGVDPSRCETFQPVEADAADALRALAARLHPEGARPFALQEEAGELKVQLAPDTADELAARRAEAWEESQAGRIRTLGIDIETYSGADLTETGAHRYAEAEDFAILLFAYSLNGGPVRVTDIASGERLSPAVEAALTDPAVTKTAFNAAFERTCLARWLGREMPPEQWRCTMAQAARCGLPLSLAGCAEALGLPVRKMAEGKLLIRRFSCPVKPSRANGNRTRWLPADDPVGWRLFKRYNRRDVEVEQAILRRLEGAPVPPAEHRLWALDQRINDRGVQADLELAAAAQSMDEAYRAELTEEARRLTGLENPGSVAQLKNWIAARAGRRLDTLRKETLEDAAAGMPEDARRVLAIRAEAGKTSTKKYGTMLGCACRDGRVRGLLQYYGAARTGRWAGRLVQVQNLPQNHLPDLARAREIVRRGDLEELRDNYGNVPQTLSELVRTALVARRGCTLTVCDFSAIEARVVAWLAGEEWALEVFRTTGKIYEAAAGRMYHVAPEAIAKTDPRRQKGKIATLALGYGGGVAALEALGGKRMGLSEAEERQIVTDWRKANPHIVRLWGHVELAALTATTTGETCRAERGLAFYRWRGALAVRLPSGRTLLYPRARVEDGRLRYAATEQATRKWGEAESYGGKLTENIVQAIARDCLAHVLLRAEAQGMPIVFHVHDEVVVEDRRPWLEELKALFASPPHWAEDLPLRGDGYVTDFYMKA